MTTEPTEEPVDLNDPDLFGSLEPAEAPTAVKEAFEGRRGVHLLDGDATVVRRDARDHQWHAVTLDTAGASDRAGFVSALSDAFDLSGLGAGSWDVLDQHLRALDLDEPNGLLVCWDGWGRFADADPDSFEMAIEIFQDACIAWEYDQFQAAVLLIGPGPETDLPIW